MSKRQRVLLSFFSFIAISFKSSFQSYSQHDLGSTRKLKDNLTLAPRKNPQKGVAMNSPSAIFHSTHYILEAFLQSIILMNQVNESLLRIVAETTWHKLTNLFLDKPSFITRINLHERKNNFKVFFSFLVFNAGPFPFVFIAAHFNFWFNYNSFNN